MIKKIISLILIILIFNSTLLLSFSAEIEESKHIISSELLPMSGYVFDNGTVNFNIDVDVEKMLQLTYFN